MEIKNCGDFEFLGVFGVCLELQRGQVIIMKKIIKSIEKGRYGEAYKNICEANKWYNKGKRH